MRNQGHVTVFLSIILISMLLLGLSVLEMARIRMGSAKAAMAAEGAACDVKAAYDKELFEEYHLLRSTAHLADTVRESLSRWRRIIWNILWKMVRATI